MSLRPSGQSEKLLTWAVSSPSEWEIRTVSLIFHNQIGERPAGAIFIAARVDNFEASFAGHKGDGETPSAALSALHERLLGESEILQEIADTIKNL